uniref:Thioredoxin domain-containing protein n=1 Tax=Peronospora matthiolae TaxID=2874970 RepID=A0AAV1T7N0_9STRA
MIAILSAADFHAAVAAATAKPLVVFFTSTQCSKSEDLAPKVAALADELAKSAAFVTVSAEELDTLVKELQVDSFPHFRVYKHNKIAGDSASSTLDEVDAFIRGLVAVDTLGTDDASSVPESAEQKTVEEEEGISATTKEKDGEEEVNGTCDAEAANGSKKRQEREELESNDEHEAKKIKTDDDGEAETVENDDAVTEEAETTDVAPEDDEAPDGTEKKREEAAAVDKIESSAVASASDVAAA